MLCTHELPLGFQDLARMMAMALSKSTLSIDRIGRTCISLRLRGCTLIKWFLPSACPVLLPDAGTSSVTSAKYDLSYEK